MKQTTKTISLVSTFAISGLIAFFNFCFANKVGNFLQFLHNLSLSERGEYYEYSKMHIAIYILTSFLILVAVLSLLFNNFYNIKAKKLLQTSFLYINILLTVTSIILLLIVYLKNYEILDILQTQTFENDTANAEFLFFTDNFILLTFQSLSNIALSILSLKNTEPIDSEQNNPIEEETEKSLIKQEIAQMKEQLELKELKDEYMKLYLQVHDDDKK